MPLGMSISLDNCMWANLVEDGFARVRGEPSIDWVGRKLGA